MQAGTETKFSDQGAEAALNIEERNQEKEGKEENYRCLFKYNYYKMQINM